MSSYKKKDGYYRRARAEGYRSRASFKLLQINKRHRVISKGDRVVDLGSAPGGWSQVAVEIAGPGNVLSADIRPMDPIHGVHFVVMDVTSQPFPDTVAEWSGGSSVDVVLSDMSPDITGNYSMDHAKSIYLAETVLAVSARILRKGGKCVVKVFQGDMLEELLTLFREQFSNLKRYSPEASRKSSSEVYLVGKGYLGGK